MLGTAVVDEYVFTITHVTLAEGKILFCAVAKNLTRKVSCGSGDLFRIHGRDGIPVVECRFVATHRVTCEPGYTMTVIFPVALTEFIGAAQWP